MPGVSEPLTIAKESGGSRRGGGGREARSIKDVNYTGAKVSAFLMCVPGSFCVRVTGRGAMAFSPPGLASTAGF